MSVSRKPLARPQTGADVVVKVTVVRLRFQLDALFPQVVAGAGSNNVG
jgi:hypothetical protein